jgi:hypothetical protein
MNTPATTRQTFALFIATEKDFRPLNLSKEQASILIAACQPLKGNKPAALELCNSILNGQLPPPPAEIIIKQISKPTFAQIWDEAHAAGMEAFNAYNGGWYPCGFASIIIKSGVCAFAKWCRKNKKTSKFYYGGEEIWVGFNTQSMDQKAVYARAFADVLNKHGIEAHVHTAID